MSAYTEAIHLNLPEAGWHRGGDGKLRIRRSLRLPEEKGLYLYSFRYHKFIQLDSGHTQDGEHTVRTHKNLKGVCPIHRRDAAALARACARQILPEGDIQIVSALAAYALDGIDKRERREGLA